MAQRFLRTELVAIVEYIVFLVFLFPRNRVTNALKSALLRLMGAQIGSAVVYYPGVWIMPGRNLRVGDNVDFALGVIVTTSGGVDIGDRTLIGYRTQILSANHRVPGIGKRIFESGHEYKTVKIERDVWIGAGCVILPGVTIGEGAVVGAGSVVSKDVDPYVFVAGVPAKEIRRRGQ